MLKWFSIELKVHVTPIWTLHVSDDKLLVKVIPWRIYSKVNYISLWVDSCTCFNQCDSCSHKYRIMLSHCLCKMSNLVSNFREMTKSTYNTQPNIRTSQQKQLALVDQESNFTAYFPKCTTIQAKDILWFCSSVYTLECDTCDLHYDTYRNISCSGDMIASNKARLLPHSGDKL